MTSDKWTKTNGSSGSDTYYADGSSLSTITNADSSYSTVSNDGQGDVATTKYSAGGIKLSTTWAQADGKTNTITYNSDGSVASTSNSVGSSSAGSDAISSSDPNAVQLSDATVGQPWSVTLSSTSADDSQFYWQLVQAPPGVTLSQSANVTNGSSGGYVNQATLSWTPSATNSVDNDIVIRVEDGRGDSTLVHYTVYLQGGNNPPVIAPISAVSGTEGQAISIPVSVSDADGDPVTTTVRNLPPGASYDAVNNQIVWTPGYTQAGTYNITVVATDGKVTTTQTFSITVAPGYAPPILNPIPAQTLSQGTAFGLQLSGSMPGGLTSPDGSVTTLSYSAANLPIGATLDPNTGWFSWTPGYGLSGQITIPITLIATTTIPGSGGGAGSTAKTTTVQNLVINLLQTPVAPRFAPAQTYYTQEGQPLQLSVFAFDPANPSYQPGVSATPGGQAILAVGTPSVTYQVTGLPPGATFDPVSAMITWTPGASQAGNYSVTITATSNGDGTGVSLSSTTTIPIVVEQVIQPPVIAQIVNATVAQGAALSIPVSATDASGIPVSYTVSGLPPFATFTQTGTGPNATGTISFAPGTNTRGDYTITVTASDNGGGDPNKVQTSSTTFVLSVTSFTEPPQLTAPSQVVAVPGQTLVVPLVATDLDQDPLTFAAQGLPPGAQIVTGGQYGEASLVWTPPAGATLGSYNISLTVTDSGLPPANTPLPIDFVPVPNVVAADLNIVLKASNNPPQILQVQANGQAAANQAATATISAAETQPVSVTVLAKDPDGDILNWTAANLPPGMTLTQTPGSNGQSQLTLNWTPGMLASKSSTPGNPAGVYTVTVSAGDGLARATQTLAFNVAHVDQTPIMQALPTQIVDEGDTVSFNVLATSPDGSVPLLSMLQSGNIPAGVSFNAATGLFQWTPPANTVVAFGAASQTFNFTFAATNGSKTTYQTVAVQVVHVDQAPQLFASNHALQVGQGFSLSVIKGGNASMANSSDAIVVNDVDGAAQTQALTVSFNNLPTGAVYNAQAGALTWTPGPGQVGDYQITANVTDNFGTTTTKVFTLRVAAAASANAPTISINTTPSMAVQPGAAVLTTVRVTAFGNIANITVATSIAGSGTWTNVQLNDAGQFTVAPTAPGVVLVRVTATDVDGNTSTRTGSILVADPQADAAPTLAWGGALVGDNLAPEVITQPALLQARIADDQLMGWQLQIAPTGTSQWSTIASQQDNAVDATGLVNLATIDPSTLANGVYEVRLTAQNLIGGSSEIDSRIEINSTSKNLTQATATDAVFQLGDHSFALTRDLPTQGNSSDDFGNWQLPILSTQLTTDQPAENSDGSTAAWSTGAQVWLQIPSSLGTANAPTQYLSFTLGTLTLALSAAPGAPTVVHPVFSSSNGWTLSAGSVNLQAEGGRLYDETTGTSWQPSGYTLTGPDGTQYTLDSSGNITGITFTDGQQWQVSDAGIALVGNDPNARITFTRNAGGQIVSVSGPGQTVLYQYDAQGRLELARNLGSSGFGTTYGYNTDGSLIVPPGGGSITANLGEAADWITTGPNAATNPTNTWSGTLSAAPINLSYFIRGSELTSTIKTQGAAGSIILSVQTQGVNVNLSAIGATVLSSSTLGNVTTTLLSVTTDGMKLLSLTGTGSANVTVSIAGDMNHDGTVDGTDATLLAQAIAAGSPSADLAGTGQIGSTDTEILDANYGFAAALAPQAIAQTGPVISTHTNLVGSVVLSSLAQDNEGNPIFWTILGATNGTATISADGRSLIFNPAPGYSGPATVTLQADDGFAASAPIIVNVNVSGAALQAIHITRVPTMTLGSAEALQVTGDFADQQGVLLTGSYLTFLSSDSDVVSADANGVLRANNGGIATIAVSADGLTAENVITAGVSPTTPPVDDSGNELNVYPLSIDLPAGVGQRQIDVHALTSDGTLGTTLNTAATGTVYYISDPSVASISPDGLITAKAGGVATITVINGGLQAILTLEVQPAVVGPTLATVANGAVTEDTSGDTLMIGAGALSADTTASISALSLSQLNMPLPAPTVLNALGAVTINLNGATSNQPLQLAVNVNSATLLAVGTQVMFWQEGTINDANGVSHQVWWLVDNGVIGSDGLAHTSSQPYAGITSGGNFLVTTTKSVNNNTGAATISGTVVNFNAIWAQQALIAMAPSPTMAAAAVGIFAGMSDVSAISYTIEGTYQLQVPQGALLPNSTISLPIPPNAPATTPTITGVQYNPTTRQLTVSGVNFIPPGQSANNFQLQVWLEPRGAQLSQTQNDGDAPVNGLIWQSFNPIVQSDGSLQITLPPGVALSQLDIYVERTAYGTVNGAQAATSLRVDSIPVEAWTVGTQDTLVTTGSGIDVFQDSGYTSGTVTSTPANAPTLLKQVTTDAQGNALQLSGAYTNQIAFSDDGTEAFIAGRNGRIYVFDTQTQDIVATVQLPYSSSATSITSLTVNLGWLYVTEGSQYGATGGQLVRINIDQMSPDYLNVIQTLNLWPTAFPAPYGYLDAAVNDGSYLALVAPTGPIPVTNGPAPQQGNIYVLDLSQIADDGTFSSSAMVALPSSSYPTSYTGKGPQYIESGTNAGQFLVSNSKDFDAGISSITFATDPDTGRLTGAASVTQVQLTPTDPNNPSSSWLQAQEQQNIQRAAGTVIVQYQGQTYALVADYNFLFNDPHFTEDDNYGLGQQIGGKIGVIQNPFGANGNPPVYLGATTPIPGVALNQLSLDGNGNLYASAFVDDTSGQYTNGQPSELMYDSLFVWNAAALIQEALVAQKAGQPLTTPIDRAAPASPQIPALTPVRYDGTSAQQMFGDIYDVGSYSPPGQIQALGQQSVRIPPAITVTPETGLHRHHQCQHVRDYTGRGRCGARCRQDQQLGCRLVCGQDRLLRWLEPVYRRLCRPPGCALAGGRRWQVER